MNFREAVHSAVSARMREKTDVIRGFVTSVNHELNTCTVGIPNPHGGIHPGANVEKPWIELKDVALPFFSVGFIGALLSLIGQGIERRGVIVGFRGGNMSFPYIVSTLHDSVALQDLDNRTVEQRTPVSKDRVINVGGSHKLVSPGLLSPKLSTPPGASFIPKVKSFEDLGAVPSIPGIINTDRLSFFNQEQERLRMSVEGTTARNTTPVSR